MSIADIKALYSEVPSHRPGPRTMTAPDVVHDLLPRVRRHGARADGVASYIQKRRQRREDQKR